MYTDLVIASKSGPAIPASKEKRILDLSDVLEYVLSAPVLLFLGNLISVYEDEDVRRPRSRGSDSVSTPGENIVG